MSSKFKKFAIVYYVRDIDRTQRFYRDLLGIDLERQPGGDESDWLIAPLDTGLELIFFTGDVRIGESPVFVFELDEGNIDTVVEHIAQSGAEIVTPVSEAPGGWSAEFLDPDGHLLSFYQTGDLPRRSNAPAFKQSKG